MKKLFTTLTLLAIIGMSGAFAQNIQAVKFQKQLSLANPGTNPLNLFNPKSTIYLMDSMYIWQYDSLTATWYNTPEGKTVDFAYNSSNKVTSETDMQLNGSTWTTLAQINYTYDSKNNIIKEIWLSYNSGSWTNMEEFTFAYNSNNQQTSDTVRYWISGAWAFSDLDVNTYTGNNMTGKLAKDWNGSAWVNDVQWTYTYNGSNECISDAEQSWNGSAWGNFRQNTYTYNGNGDEVLDVQQKWSGTAWINASNSKMYYNSNNVMISSATRDWNNPATKINGGDSAYYYYKTVSGINELPAQGENISVYPNPVSNNLTIDYTGKATINIFNTQGQLIETLFINNNLSNIDVSNLPCGVYMMELRTEKGNVVKKFMKE